MTISVSCRSTRTAHRDIGQVFRFTALTCLSVALLASTAVSVAQTFGSNQGSSGGTVPNIHSVTEPPQIKLRLTETISSATARVGQHVSLEAVDPVEIGGRVIVAVGAPANGTVSIARRRGRNHRDGKLILIIQNVSRLDGTHADLQSASLATGTGKGAPIFGPCTFPFPADPVGLFRKGENVVIPKGTELVATMVSESR
jgi:hypothetical protein